jgi:hypothetical protein
VAALVGGAQQEAALGGLAAGQPLGGRLDAVVDGVAQEVGERPLERLQEGLVQRGPAGVACS